MKINCSKSKLKRVGEKLRHRETLAPEEDCLLKDFRSGHKNIIESFRNYHKTILKNERWKRKGVLFAARLKKKVTLVHKLANRHSKMDLTRMNDIAGCRLIFRTLKDLKDYRELFNQRMQRCRRFKQIQSSTRDYICLPRDTGYRGIHDVYEEETDDGYEARIEIQYRTITQHLWATAVEIWDQNVEEPTQGNAKFGLANLNIQRLFKLYAELLWIFREIGEEGEINASEFNLRALHNEIQEVERQFGVLAKLESIKSTKRSMKKLVSEQILLNRVEVEENSRKNVNLEIENIKWELINAQLFEKEEDLLNDPVYVLTDPRHLREVYNNYFNDARNFVKTVKKAMRKLTEIVNKKKGFFKRKVLLDLIFQD